MLMGFCTLEEAGLVSCSIRERNCLCNWDSRFSRERRQRLGMGAVSCRQGQHSRVAVPHKQGGNIRGPWARGWKSLWSDVGTIRSDLEELWEPRGHHYLHRESLKPAPLLKPLPEWPVPQFINLFLPEFPIRPIRGQQQLKILGLVAKGSFGTVLKVLDCTQKAIFAVKVVPKVKVLQRDTVRQCKEEVSIQVCTESWKGLWEELGHR